ncbi:MAG: hypothetical protein U0586_09855 [Candidatus Brocadiaceae bacterium]
MCKKFIITLGILLAVAFAGGTVDMSYRTVFAHEHERGHHGCDHCGHYVCPGDCGKCDECIARRKAAKEAAKKCEKCGHEECSGNCNRCVDCLQERIKKLEKELEKK